MEEREETSGKMNSNVSNYSYGISLFHLNQRKAFVLKRDE